MGCGIQRTPGDKVTVEQRTKKSITRVCLCGGIFIEGVRFLPCYTVAQWRDGLAAVSGGIRVVAVPLACHSPAMTFHGTATALP